MKKKMQNGGMTKSGMPGKMGKNETGKISAGAGSGVGRAQKSGMQMYGCGGKVKAKRGYGSARKG